MMPYDWDEDKSYSELFLPADYVRGEAECFGRKCRNGFVNGQGKSGGSINITRKDTDRRLCAVYHV